jgi:hypothetical protein
METNSEAKELGRDIQKNLQRLAVLTVVIFILLGVLTVYVTSVNHALGVKGDKARIALCAFKHDLQERTKSGEDFLRTHPNGIPGISAAQIQANISLQNRTIKSLSNLDCP